MKESWGDYRPWDFVADMNMDGLITITDVWLWFKWLFFFPGDSLISFLGPSAVGRFFEMSPENYGGGFSFLVSAFFWMSLTATFVAQLNAIRWEDEGKSMWFEKRPSWRAAALNLIVIYGGIVLFLFFITVVLPYFF